ncbi:MULTISPECIES: hypothetical protein [Faecalicoccus]|uniref:hypothetical protein n=1 Tax=Faecalicoccus TaxID=1573536 RepID=UPI0019600EA3|nr:hypothetical protein [Faecalicoccus pleomorphus]MBM6764725.1 hypothetical protein [Faecalicoccus pleomorphus]
MADKIIKYMSQEWIDQLNEEFEQLSINDSIRMENARIKRAKKKGREEGQKDLIKLLSQTMTAEEISKATQKPLEEIQNILK